MDFMLGSGFEAVTGISFFAVLVMFVLIIAKNVSTWNNNNHSPRLTVEADIVSKRTQVTHQQHANAGDPTGAHGFHTTTSTAYYICFQFDTGDRLELQVDGKEYGALAEGDHGKLTFQGTRYLGFERQTPATDEIE